ncbi:MAG: M48 family metallopeptidase, partial [Planctomycetota bacterium]
AIFLYDVVLLVPALVMILTVVAFQHRYEFRRGRVSLSAARYMWLRFRVEMAIILVPWLLLVVVSATAALLFHDSELAHAADTVATGVTLVVIITFSPLMLRGIWVTSSLPAGALRERLERFCRTQGFRCHDILVWHTHRHLANAGVVGPTALLRYVLLSDALLDHCTDEEVEAIFAHEMGHVRHHHLAFYIIFGVGFLSFYANLIDLLSLAGWTTPLGSLLAFDLTGEQATVMLIFAAVYWLVIFGYISRRMELQADLLALESVEDPTAVLSALGKLGAVSSVPRVLSSWRHFSIEKRLQFLGRVLRDRRVAGPFRRKTATVKVAVLAVLALATVRLLLARPELFGA